jgi:Fe-S-cluster containining protein
MTDCSRCGACCDPVVLMFKPEDMTGPSGPFAREHWQVIGERVNRNDDSGRTEYLIECDQFDKATRLCTAHDSRPPICSGYPWYSADPNVNLVLDPTCSFQADVRTMLPVVEVRHGPPEGVHHGS